MDYTLYVIRKDNAYKRFKQKIDTMDLEYQLKKVGLQDRLDVRLTKKFIMFLLDLSENGFEDLLVNGSESKKIMDTHTTNELINLLIKKPRLIKPYFFYAKNKQMIFTKTYNDVDEYTALLPREKRELAHFYEYQRHLTVY